MPMACFHNDQTNCKYCRYSKYFIILNDVELIILEHILSTLSERRHWHRHSNYYIKITNNTGKKQ